MKKNTVLNNIEVATFCEQMAMILDAGISPIEGIMAMVDDTENDEGHDILMKIYDACSAGETFHKAMCAAEVFPKYVLDMVEIGERSGKLDEVMASLAIYYNREESISRGIKNAVTYPFIIIIMMLVVIIVLVVKVLPIFNEVFIQLGSEMKGFSKGLMNFGLGLGNYAVVIVGLIAVIGAMAYLFLRSSMGKNMKDSILSGFFVTRKLYDRIASGRFASGMALTLNAGLDVDESLDMVTVMTDNERLGEKVEKCKEIMLEGHSLSDGLVQSGIFSNLYGHMISVGYKTGSLDKVLAKIAEGYEEEVDERISNIIAVLEPMLVIILSVFICMILMSVMLPLISIMTSIG